MKNCSGILRPSRVNPVRWQVRLDAKNAAKVRRLAEAAVVPCSEMLNRIIAQHEETE